MTDVFTTRVDDWGVTSYGDLSVMAGLGFGCWHFNFRSRSLNQAMNFLMVGAGVGVSAEVEGRVGTLVNQWAARVKGAMDGMAGYTDVPRGRPFSFADIHGSRGTLSSRNLAVGVGSSGAVLSLCSSARDGAVMFERLQMSGMTVGIGVGVSAVYGVLSVLQVAGDPAELGERIRRGRYERERDHYRGAPAIRDPGGV